MSSVVSYTYPGVYLTETSDLPRTVTPATTSRTAFIGPYLKGPVAQAALVSSWSQFANLYGGIDPASLASYAVAQFFLNGGGNAWIVRVVPGGAAAATIAASDLTLDANSPGAWANGISAAFTAVQTVNGKPVTSLVLTSGTTTLETLSNLDASSDAALAQAISAGSSYLVASVTTPPGNAPATVSTDAVVLAGGSDGDWGTDGSGFGDAVLLQVNGSGVTPTAPQPSGALLDRIAPEVFNIMCIPDMAWLPMTAQESVLDAALAYCNANHAFFIGDPPPPAAAALAAGAPAWGGPTVDEVGSNPTALAELLPPSTPGDDPSFGSVYINPENGCMGAAYYPWVAIADPANGFQPRLVPPSGTVAGIYASTDASRGVWKAPAGVDASLGGVLYLGDPTLNDQVNGELNVMGVNCLRAFAGYGNIVWGARTLAGSDLVGSAWKYVSVRRLTDFIEQSLLQSLKWAVFEPNGPTLWSTIALEVGAFMNGLFAQGAFAGSSAALAYQVACDATTTTPQDMLQGVVNVFVGFQPSDPAEFVALTVQVNAGPSGS